MLKFYRQYHSQTVGQIDAPYLFYACKFIWFCFMLVHFFGVYKFDAIHCQFSEILFSCSQQHQGPPNISKSALCHNHLLAILCVFSVNYLVNYALMNSAANVFYSAGLVLVTFQDAMSLMEQVFPLFR